METQNPNCKKYFWPLVISSTILGILAGVFPFLYGVIPGAIGGLIVAPIWYRLMVARVEREFGPRLILYGFLYGALMGLLATIFLHGCMTLGIAAMQVGTGSVSLLNDLFVTFSILMMFGGPIGLVAGGVLGVIFGALFQKEFNKDKTVSTDDDGEEGK